MFGGQDGLRRIMSQDTLKPRNVSETLAQFGHYFRSYWAVLGLVILLVVVTTWSQVTAPELIGQAVDCYITGPVSNAFSNIAGLETIGSAAESNCWYEPNTTGLSTDERLAGLTSIIVRIIGLYVLGSVLT